MIVYAYLVHQEADYQLYICGDHEGKLGIAVG